jgi:hypothetical protein
MHTNVATKNKYAFHGTEIEIKHKTKSSIYQLFDTLDHNEGNRHPVHKPTAKPAHAISYQTTVTIHPLVPSINIVVGTCSELVIDNLDTKSYRFYHNSSIYVE